MNIYGTFLSYERREGDSEFDFAPELLVLAFTSLSFSFSCGKIIDRPGKDWTNILPGYQDILCLGILLFSSALPMVAWIQFGWVLCATCLCESKSQTPWSLQLSQQKAQLFMLLSCCFLLLWGQSYNEICFEKQRVMWEPLWFCTYWNRYNHSHFAQNSVK